MIKRNFSFKRQLWLLMAAIVGSFIYFNRPLNLSEVVFTDLNGEKISSRSLHGKVVLVNFWSISCSYCIQEMPQLAETYNKYKNRDFEMIAVATHNDPANYVLDYVKTSQIPFKVALDINDSLAKSFGNVRVTPTTFIIGKNGKIIKTYVGVPDFGEMNQLLEKALAAG